MANLEKRVSQLEKARATVNVKAMTDEELDAYIATFETVSSEFMIALTTKINRHGSTFPIIYDDPEYPSKKELPI